LRAAPLRQFRQVGARTAARHHQRARQLRVAQPEAQGGEASHRQADDVGARDAEMLQHGGDVVAGMILAVEQRILRHLRRRVAARRVGDASALAREISQLQFPLAMIRAVFVHEDDRMAGAGFLVVKTRTGRLSVWHDPYSRRRTKMRGFRFAALAAAGFLLCGAALAQGNYPNKPIKFVVPFPPGGNLDFVARNLQPKMQEVLGQPVIIDNKGGNAGMIGLEYASKQPGDGYTIVLGNTGTLAINQAVYPKMNYDALKDFVPIGITTTNALLATIAGNVPANNLQEFVAY